MSVTQAVSAVGSFALVIVAGMIWWWSDLSGKADATHQEYLDLSDDVELVERKSRELRNEIEDLDDEEAELRAAAREARGGRLTDDTEALSTLATTVNALRDRTAVPYQLFAWLSYTLLPLGPDRPAEVKRVLGAELEGGHISLESLEITDDVIVVEGYALDEREIAFYATRLGASAYVTAVSVNDKARRNFPALNRTYWRFKLSAELRAVEIPDELLGGEDEDEDEDEP